jgi:hypothetical protein
MWNFGSGLEKESVKKLIETSQLARRLFGEKCFSKNMEKCLHIVVDMSVFQLIFILPVITSFIKVLQYSVCFSI